MVKADIVNCVSEESDLPRVRAARAVNTILGAMKEALSEGKSIELRGFGVFEVRERKKRFLAFRATEIGWCSSRPGLTGGSRRAKPRWRWIGSKPWSLRSARWAFPSALREVLRHLFGLAGVPDPSRWRNLVGSQGW